MQCVFGCGREWHIVCFDIDDDPLCVACLHIGCAGEVSMNVRHHDDDGPDAGAPATAERRGSHDAPHD